MFSEAVVVAVAVTGMGAACVCAGVAAVLVATQFLEASAQRAIFSLRMLNHSVIFTMDPVAAFEHFG